MQLTYMRCCVIKSYEKINFYNQQRKEKVGKLLTNLRDAGLDMTD